MYRAHYPVYEKAFECRKNVANPCLDPWIESLVSWQPTILAVKLMVRIVVLAARFLFFTPQKKVPALSS